MFIRNALRDASHVANQIEIERDLGEYHLE